MEKQVQRSKRKTEDKLKGSPDDRPEVTADPVQWQERMYKWKVTLIGQLFHGKRLVTNPAFMWLKICPAAELNLPSNSRQLVTWNTNLKELAKLPQKYMAFTAIIAHY